VLAVLRFEASDDGGGFLDAATEALRLLAQRPGFRSGQLARAYDQTDLWCLVTEWESVGAYRRALGSYEVRAGATAVLSQARPEPSAFESLATVQPLSGSGTATAGPAGDSAGAPPATVVLTRSDRSLRSRP
jgi:heme-degrading monooxygenase HmoA